MFGIHSYVTVYEDKPRIVQYCNNCKCYRSSMHDMSYGDTYWVTGNMWM